MCGPDYYDRLGEEQRRIFGEDLPRLQNAMQSNLLLVDDAWIPSLRRFLGNEPRIGTSFDVVEGVRGWNGAEAFEDRWLRAARLLHREGFSVGMVYVAHRASLGRAKDLYYYFRNLGFVGSVRFNPLYRQGRGGTDASRALLITPQEYGQFLVDLCDVWMDDAMAFSIMPLREWYRAWHGGNALCCDCRGDCHHSHLGIDSEGDVFNCGRVSDNGMHRLGNVFEEDLDTLLLSPARTMLDSRSAVLKEGHCRNCRYWSLCHGGCPAIGWLYFGSQLRETYFCPARKRLFAHFETLFGPPVQGGTFKPEEVAW